MKDQATAAEDTSLKNRGLLAMSKSNNIHGCCHLNYL